MYQNPYYNQQQNQNQDQQNNQYDFPQSISRLNFSRNDLNPYNFYNQPSNENINPRNARNSFLNDNSLPNPYNKFSPNNKTFNIYNQEEQSFFKKNQKQEHPKPKPLYQQQNLYQSYNQPVSQFMPQSLQKQQQQYQKFQNDIWGVPKPEDQQQINDTKNEQLKRQQQHQITQKDADQIQQKFSRWFLLPNPHEEQEQQRKTAPVKYEGPVIPYQNHYYNGPLLNQEQEKPLTYEQLLEINKKKHNKWLQTIQENENIPNQIKHFYKYLVEQINIDFELEHYREYINQRWPTAVLFKYFDMRNKQKFTINDFILALEELNIHLNRDHLKTVLVKQIHNNNGKIEDPNNIGQQYLGIIEFSSIFHSFQNQKSSIWDFNNQYQIGAQNFPQDLKQSIESLLNKLIATELTLQSFKQFLPQQDEEELLKIFMHLDTDQKGYLNVQNIIFFLDQADGQFEDQELHGVMNRLTINNSTRINFEHFLNYLRKGQQIPGLNPQNTPAKIIKPAVLNNPNQDNKLQPDNHITEIIIAGFQKYSLKQKK